MKKTQTITAVVNDPIKPALPATLEAQITRYRNYSTVTYTYNGESCRMHTTAYDGTPAEVTRQTMNFINAKGVREWK
jgi:protein involved in ribonucleotide reduction